MIPGTSRTFVKQIPVLGSGTIFGTQQNQTFLLVFGFYMAIPRGVSMSIYAEAILADILMGIRARFGATWLTKHQPMLVKNLQFFWAKL